MIAFKITIGRWNDVIDYLNGWYGSKLTFDDIIYIIDTRLLVEVAENTYRDTNIREELMDSICKQKIAMRWPINGDNQEYKDRFNKLAKGANII